MTAIPMIPSGDEAAQAVQELTIAVVELVAQIREGNGTQRAEIRAADGADAGAVVPLAKLPEPAHGPANHRRGHHHHGESSTGIGAIRDENAGQPAAQAEQSADQNLQTGGLMPQRRFAARSPDRDPGLGSGRGPQHERKNDHQNGTAVSHAAFAVQGGSQQENRSRSGLTARLPVHFSTDRPQAFTISVLRQELAEVLLDVGAARL